jgi:hypothetical protein
MGCVLPELLRMPAPLPSRMFRPLYVFLYTLFDPIEFLCGRHPRVRPEIESQRVGEAKRIVPDIQERIQLERITETRRNGVRREEPAE